MLGENITVAIDAATACSRASCVILGREVSISFTANTALFYFIMMFTAAYRRKYPGLVPSALDVVEA